MRWIGLRHALRFEHVIAHVSAVSPDLEVELVEAPRARAVVCVRGCVSLIAAVTMRYAPSGDTDRYCCAPTV